ncbi:fimbrial protein [Salmonella enterica]|nr:fimbrial protein [Salmonella enterica]
MTGRLLNFKAMLAGLVIMSCSFSAIAVTNACEVTSGQNINFRNINLTTDEFRPGPNSVIYSISQNVDFECHVSFIHPDRKPALVFNQGYFSQLSVTLGKMGLGFQVTMTENGQAPVFYSWNEIKNTGAGSELSKDFGDTLTTDKVTQRRAVMKIDFLYLTAYGESSAVKDIPGISGVLNIVPFPFATRPSGFTLSPFNIKILRRGLGRVDITPSLVSLGHFYTTHVPSQTRQANFTVTARQALRPAVGQNFTIPLAVTFKSNTLSASDAGPQALKIVSQDGPDKGQPNGLLLSIKDESGQMITFDKKGELGDININAAISGNVSKTYTAVVTPAPGGTVNTGNFSAEIPVIVTYN